MIKSIFIAVLVVFSTVSNAQSSINTAGGEATGSGGTVSYSVGQAFYTVPSGTGGTLTEGVQQTQDDITYVYDNGWSPNDPSGSATATQDILIRTGDATITTTTICNNLTVRPGAGLTVEDGATLTPSGQLLLESISTSYSSLILEGTADVSGTINYDRHVNTNGSGTTGDNDLIAAPLSGQAFNQFVLANPNIFNDGGTPVTQYLFGPFNKSTGTYEIYDNNTTATLDEGIGYRAASDDNSPFTFTGVAYKDNLDLDIENAGSQFQEWNLIGNPYPSYLNVRDFLTFDVDPGAPVVTNLDLFDPATAAIYGYDGDATNGWVTLNLANSPALPAPQTLIAPGQGFFVSADATQTATYDLAFRPSMRSTGNSDDFIAGRNAQLIFVKLGLNSASNNYTTDFYFNDASTLGLDVGYDAGIWGGTAPAFSIYSELVEGSTGVPLAIQSLNTTDLSDVTIPLGINANIGEQITFTITETTLPSTVEVYLDDTVANTATLLTASDYILTPSADLMGTGRFFLRIAENSLSVDENVLNRVHIYIQEQSKELVVAGELEEGTVLDLYDLQGRRVLSRQLDAAVLQNTVDISNLAGSVYVVTVNNKNYQRTKKIIIK